MGAQTYSRTGRASPEAVTSCTHLGGLIEVHQNLSESVSCCTSDTDDLESSSIFNVALPSLPGITARLDLMVVTATKSRYWIEQVSEPIGVRGVCCP